MDILDIYEDECIVINFIKFIEFRDLEIYNFFFCVVGNNMVICLGLMFCFLYSNIL